MGIGLKFTIGGISGVGEDELQASVRSHWEDSRGWMWGKFSSKLPLMVLVKLAEARLNLES